MPASQEDVRFIDEGLRAIDAVLGAETARQPRDTAIKAGFDESPINNTAYHDYYRIELGTPVIKTQVLDKQVPTKLGKIIDLTSKMPWLFGTSVTTAEPTDADQVEELITEMKVDLANMAAGPVPAVVQTFVVTALADYIDQSLWTALSPSERDRLGQLASAWTSMTAQPASGGGNGPSEAGRSSDSLVDKALNFIDPGGLFH